ncbi:ABC transporter substrate-binding protein [Niveispirillum sp. KHB5.9]|uniref:ABC transporter substrate-binding protein n=1 Tax=Niveispirillum sp. KHB5.9 TaxID=3400269 RepID=UPI003A8B527E
MMIARRLLLAASLLLAAPLAPAQEQVHLRMSWWGGNDVHRAQLRALEAFEARYPDIKVTAEYTGWVGHLERLTTQIAGGTAPDVMMVNWNWLKLFSRDGDGFLDLHGVADIIDLGQFDRDALSMSSVRGRLNGLPPNMTARLFWFNETTFRKAGLKVPDSWEALMAAGPVFRQRLGPDYYPLDMNFQDTLALLYSWMSQRSQSAFIDEEGRRLLPDRHLLTEAARLYQQLVDNHVVPSARQRASFGHVQLQETRPWITGRYAGAYQWTSAIGKYVETLEPGQRMVLAPYPMLPGAADPGLLYKPAMMYAINRDTRHPRESALLLQFLLNDPEGVRILGARRGVPASAAARRTLEEDGQLTGLALEGQRQIESLPRGIVLSGYYEHARVRDGFNDILEKQGYGMLTPEEAGKAMEREINGILQRVIK